MKEIFYPLLHSPNDCYGQSWASPKLGARSVFQVEVGAQGLGLPLLLSQAHKQGGGSGSRASRT